MTIDDLPDETDDQHVKVQQLRELARWSEGMAWCSPERRNDSCNEGADRLDTAGPGVVSPTQGKTLAVMQVSGGSQSFRKRVDQRSM